MLNHISYLDCTLRDGGYYNKWKFEKKQINRYLSAISKTRINYVEIGFRKFKNNIALGETGFSSEKFINSLNLDKNTNYGVMVNASDLIFGGKLNKNYKKLFPKKTKIKFIRLACHELEIFKIKEVISYLKKQNYQIFVNLMQISEIKKVNLIKILKFLNKTPTDIFYIADSLGSLSPRNINNLIKLIKKNWKKDLGIHAHDNLGLALKNSNTAVKAGANWVDSTVLGMGRGPGNTKTEEILKQINAPSREVSGLKKIINNYFNKLKKKYKWGKNSYYAVSAKNSIHPTFVQEILSDQRIKKNEKIKALNYLKLIPSKKFNPMLINNFLKFNQKTKNYSHFLPKGFFNQYKVIIIAGGEISISKIKKIKKFTKEKNIFILSINLNKNITKKLINMFVFSHPLQIQSQLNLVKTGRHKIVYPFSFLNKKLPKTNPKQVKNLYNFGLSVNNSNKINVNQNDCNLPEPLGIGYAISICIAKGCKSLYFAGVDNIKNKNKFDNSSILLQKMKRKFPKISFKSI